MISSSTTSDVEIDISAPSRITLTAGAVRRLNFSMVSFARISWKIPIAMLTTIIIKPKQSLNAPTHISDIAMPKQSMFKNVKIFSIKILLYVFTFWFGVRLV